MTHNEFRAAIKQAWMDVMHARSEAMAVRGKIDVQVAKAVARCDEASKKLVDLMAVDTTKLEG